MRTQCTPPNHFRLLGEGLRTTANQRNEVWDASRYAQLGANEVWDASRYAQLGASVAIVCMTHDTSADDNVDEDDDEDEPRND